ncbi:MAG TPA: hypothetical protein VIU15_24260, partial [Streptomyces sp.]
MGTFSARQAMTNAGIVQEGAPVLARPARPFTLPAEAGEAEDVVRERFDAISRVRELHTFGKGMSIAAPQLGIDRCAAVVVPPEAGAQPVELLNAWVEESSAHRCSVPVRRGGAPLPGGREEGESGTKRDLLRLTSWPCFSSERRADCTAVRGVPNLPAMDSWLGTLLPAGQVPSWIFLLNAFLR